MENEQKKYWFFGSKLNTALLFILIILMVIALRWMYQDKEKYFSNNRQYIGSEGNIVVDPGPPVVSDENADKEVFTLQPGAVKSIDGWTLSVDLLTPNQNWIPGVSSSGPFFLNQSQKIRNLKVTNDTIIYPCNPSSQNISTYLASIQKRVEEYNNLSPEQKNGSYISYYFDIDGSTIYGIHDQCLP